MSQYYNQKNQSQEIEGDDKVEENYRYHVMEGNNIRDRNKQKKNYFLVISENSTDVLTKYNNIDLLNQHNCDIKMIDFITMHKLEKTKKNNNFFQSAEENSLEVKLKDQNIERNNEEEKITNSEEISISEETENTIEKRKNKFKNLMKKTDELKYDPTFNIFADIQDFQNDEESIEKELKKKTSRKILKTNRQQKRKQNKRKRSRSRSRKK